MKRKMMSQKMISRIGAWILAAGLFGEMLSAPAVAANAEVKTQCEAYEGSNINAQDYGNHYPYWSSTVTSYLTPTADGGVMRVQAGGSIDGLLVEYYDASHNIQTSKTKHIKEELPLFGGFYASGNAYYVLTGQDNRNQDPQVEVFRITKYDTDWKRLGSDGLADCNTTVPFYAGSARMEASGDDLMVRTAHEMYQSADGLNHQANVTIQFDTKNMKITDSFTAVSNHAYGYVSHSFNQFIHIEDGYTVAVDHGDAYPRCIALIKSPVDVTGGSFQSGYGSQCEVISVMDFPWFDNYNDTGSSVGAFELSDSSYLIAGNTGVYGKDGPTDRGSTYNVFVASVAKTGEGSENAKIHWLTDYKEGDGTASTPHMVKLSGNRFVVLWSKEDCVYYMPVDGNGNPETKEPYLMKGQLSDCAPVVSNGRITWYTWENGTITFYDINVSNLASNQKTVIENGHHYNVVKTEGGIATLQCSVCGEKKQLGTYTQSDILWTKDPQGWYYGSFSNPLAVGDTLYFWMRGSGAPSGVELDDEWNVEISDPNRMSCSMTRKDMGYFTMRSSGNVTVKIYPKYNPNLAKTYTVSIQSEPIESFEISPASLDMKEGESRILTVSIKPDSADQTVTFSSSNTGVAVVDSEGTVTAVKEGTAVITATAADGSHTAKCTVTVAHEHSYDTVWHYDSASHWHECAGNSAHRGSEAPHSMKEVVEREEAGGVHLVHQECSVCGYKTATVTEVVIDAEDTVLTKDAQEAIQGKDVTLEIALENDFVWKINGKQLPASGLKDIDLAVEKKEDQLIFHENGELGFTAQLAIPADAQMKGDKAVLLQKTSQTGTQLQLADVVPVKESQSVMFEISRKADSTIIYGTNGDTDGDGAVKLTDMMQVLHHVSSRKTLSEVQKGFADVDMNNKVEIQDLMRELHFVSGRSQSVYDGIQ